MPLGIRQDLQQEPPGRGIALAELAHEGRVRRHLLRSSMRFSIIISRSVGPCSGAPPRRGLPHVSWAIDGDTPNC